jgi:hypothetical protein
MRRASATSMALPAAIFHGSSVSHSRYVRIIEYSPDASGMRSRRFNSLRACFSTSSACRLRDRLRDLLELGRALLAFSQLLLDRAHLLAQHVLAVGVADGFARLLVDVARDLQDLDALGEEVEHLVEPRLEVEGLEQALLVLGGNVHEAGDEVGELARALDRLQRGDHFLRHLRRQLEDFGRALLERALAPEDLRVGAVGFLDELHARHRERIALEELQHAESAAAPGRWRGARPRRSRSG